MRPTKHVPDSEPDKRGTGRWFAYGSLLPSLPEVGAVCGKAARTDLGGGREVTRALPRTVLFAALHESACGTSQANQSA